MNASLERIKKSAMAQEKTWGVGYHVFSEIIEQHGLKVGVEVGVGFGGHAEAMLRHTTINKLYGVDPYPGWHESPELLCLYVFERLLPFGERYQHISKPSVEAVQDIGGKVDFVYIDADHSYESVWKDLRAWLPKIKAGGIMGGHDYGNGPGVERAVDELFTRLGWTVIVEAYTVWWTKVKEWDASRHHNPCLESP